MKQSGFGIASLILGIVGLVFSCFIVGIIPAFLGLIFAIIALCQKNTKNGMAIAGLICSIIGIVFSAIIILLGIAGSGNTSQTVSTNKKQEEVIKQLDLIVEIIDNKKKKLQLLDTLVKSRFVEMFGDPDTNAKDWEEDALSEKLNVVGGYAFKSDQFDENSGIPVLRIANINAGYFKPVNMVYWKEDKNL